MKKYLFLSTLVLMQACSSSDSDTTPFDNLYSTSGLQGDGTATVRITELAASDSADIVYAGTLEKTKGSSEMLNGVLLTPHELGMSVTDLHLRHEHRATMHTDERDFLVRLATEEGLVCDTDSPDGMPSYVKLGDSGVLSKMTCDDKTTVKRGWRVEAGDNTTTNIIQSITITDEFDAITYTADVTYAIANNGDISTPPVDPYPNSTLGYCGAGKDDLGTQLNCAGYPARRMAIPPKGQNAWIYQTDGCDLDVKYELSGPNQEGGIWQAAGATDFWVIHGCDGAGLMNDNAGANFYIEHYTGRFNDAARTLQNPQQYEGTQCSETNPATNKSYCWLTHTGEPFRHPGTTKSYWIRAGMYTFNQGDFPDSVAGKPWWNGMKLGATSNFGNKSGGVLTAFAVMYPWVCHGPWDYQNDWSDYWGTKNNWQQQLPYGDNTYKTNCYYDNEPWDGLSKGTPPGYKPHFTSSQIPPEWYAYKFEKNDSDGSLFGYVIGQKLPEEGIAVVFQDITDPTTCNATGHSSWDTKQTKCVATKFELVWKNGVVPSGY